MIMPLKRTSRWLKPLILFALMGTTACSGMLGSFSSLDPGSLNPPLVTLDPLATQTPTPFMPAANTPTPIVEATPTNTPLPSPTPSEPWGSFPGPSEATDTVLPPMPRIEMPEDAFNILIMGADTRARLLGTRTDTIIVLSVSRQEGTAKLLSIPRDFYAYIPGWKNTRINAAYGHGGAELAELTVLYNFGIEIDRFVRVNYHGFRRAIDLLGGIDVNVGNYVADSCYGQWMSFSPGTTWMDGRTALCYARMRKTTSDFHRMGRQQEVLRAIFWRMLSLDALGRIPELYDLFRWLAETDIELNDVLPYIPLATQLAAHPKRIEAYTIKPPLVNDWIIAYSGAYVLLPDRQAIYEMLQDTFKP
jgi:LCP family protein required for cell wall assembly